MIKRRIGSAFVLVGVVLLLAALLLFLYNQQESQQAGESAHAALSAMQQAIAENQDTPEPIPQETEFSTEPVETETIPVPTELTVVEFEGYRYIGYLSIPAYELELPIMDTWSMDRLKIAPCLQYGSPLTDDAVIAGHNYKHHFLPLHTIQPGEKLSFTDMTGYTIDYTVTKTTILDPRDVYEVINSEHDLILYTCTTGGKSRVVVFCDRAEPSTESEKIPEA